MIDTNHIKSENLIELIESLPDSDDHIFYDTDEKQWYVTSEWLCGSFAGRGFTGTTKEEAASELIKYLYEHINHDSMVGRIVTDSGFPDLKKVKNYCLDIN